jgi:DNA-binding transcriptional ArsR family regulator
VEKKPAPSLLPILRSQQQGEILALLLGDPDLELSLTEISERTGAPGSSVFREIERAEQAGLLTTRRVGHTRLVRASTAWAARHAGQPGQRPVGDIDVLVLGEPDRDQLYEALSAAEQQLGRPVEATIRDADWLESGSGAFHGTVVNRPLLKLDLPHQ